VCSWPGYDGSTNEWDSRYAGHEGMEMPQVSLQVETCAIDSVQPFCTM
jgi:hypothetical protein